VADSGDLRGSLAAFAEAVGRPLTTWQADTFKLDVHTTVVVAPRQSGKSRCLAVLALHRAFRRSEQHVLIVSASEEAARRLLADATAFAQWNAAKRLVERGARTTLFDAAALGLLDRVSAAFVAEDPPRRQVLISAFWGACHGGQRATAEYLLACGADLNWIGYDGLTPLDAARRSAATEVVEWLRGRGARSARACGLKG